MTTVPTIEQLNAALGRMARGAYNRCIPPQPYDDDVMIGAAIEELAELRERATPVADAPTGGILGGWQRDTLETYFAGAEGGTIKRLTVAAPPRRYPTAPLAVGPADGCMCGGELVEVDDRRQAYPWRWHICRKCGGATTNSGKYLPPDSGFGLPRLGDATTVEIGVERREAAPTTVAPIVEAARNYVAAIRTPAPDPADEADRDAWEDEIETTQAALVAAVLAAASPSLRVAGVPR